jgi:hypothetical protein
MPFMQYYLISLFYIYGLRNIPCHFMHIVVIIYLLACSMPLIIFSVAWLYTITSCNGHGSHNPSLYVHVGIFHTLAKYSLVA